MKENKDLISVIVPVYNVEKYIRRCLDSIVNQTYSNLEIILIDDGSKDASGKICDEYAKKDNRITVIHKKNGGLSSARNVGIENSNGKYITFIDSDDMIKENFISVLYDNLINFDSQISICGYKFVYNNMVPFDVDKKKEKISVFSSEKALMKMLYQKQINNSAWGKLYLKSIFKDIRYPEGKIYEDIPVTYKTFLKSNRIVLTSAQCYFYTKREESISSSFNEKTLDIIENVNTMAEDLKKYKKLKRAVNSRILNADFFVIRQIDKNKYPSVYFKLNKDIKKRRMTSLLDINTRLKTKLGIIVSFFGFNNLSRIYNKNKNLSIIKKLD